MNFLNLKDFRRSPKKTRTLRCRRRQAVGAGFVPSLASRRLVIAGCIPAQQVGQKDVPPLGGFEGWFFIKVRRLRLASVSGAPHTVLGRLQFDGGSSQNRR